MASSSSESGRKRRNTSRDERDMDEDTQPTGAGASSSAASSSAALLTRSTETAPIANGRQLPARQAIVVGFGAPPPHRFEEAVDTAIAAIQRAGR